MTETPFVFRLAFAIVVGAATLVLVGSWVETWVMAVVALWVLAGLLAVAAWASWRARRLDRKLRAALDRQPNPALAFVDRLERLLDDVAPHARRAELAEREREWGAILDEAERVRIRAEAARRRLETVEAILDEHGRAELERLRQDAEGEALPPSALPVHLGVPADETPGGFHHELSDTCPCGPHVVYVDHDGTTLETPLVVHHALDGRP